MRSPHLRPMYETPWYRPFTGRRASGLYDNYSVCVASVEMPYYSREKLIIRILDMHVISDHLWLD